MIRIAYLIEMTTIKAGAEPHAGAAKAWVGAALACMGVVFGDIGTSPLYIR
jgi:KUP system potassium uptake protein